MCLYGVPSEGFFLRFSHAAPAVAVRLEGVAQDVVHAECMLDGGQLIAVAEPGE